MSKFQRVKAARWVSFFWLSALLLAVVLGQCPAQAAEQRFALVIGNDEYKSAKLATPANDAGLVANALTGAGFAVTGARNLDQATLRESFREFLGQVAAAGPDAVAVVYLAGFGVQFAGENYFVPVDADIARDVDVPLQAVRVSDFAQPLAALPGRVKIIIVDAARQNPFARGGDPLATGLALVDPWPEQVYEWHREGFDLPAGTELLAEGDMFEVQAFRHGRSYALQFHPDVTHATMHRWMASGHDRLAMPGAKPRDTHFADRAVYDYSARAWLSVFLERWIAG